jgi:hypothetical protein
MQITPIGMKCVDIPVPSTSDSGKSEIHPSDEAIDPAAPATPGTGKRKKCVDFQRDPTVHFGSIYMDGDPKKVMRLSSTVS